MSTDALSDAPKKPLWMRATGITVAGLALFVFFVFLGFPYDELADALSLQVERASGVRLTFDDVSPHLGLLGPGIQARGVTAIRPDNVEIAIDRVVARPAWSLSWLTLDPAVHLDLRRGDAVIAGTVTLSGEPGWDGEVRDLDLRLLPIESLMPGGTVDGTLSGEAELWTRGEEIHGTVVFTLADGSLAFSGMPVGVPFDALEGDLQFGGDLFAQVNKLDLRGPMLSAQATGNVGKAARRGDEALDLAVDLQVNDRNMKGAVRGLGIRVAGDGNAKIRITGPLSSPQVVRGG